MGLKTFKPRTPGLRHRVSKTFSELTEVKPVRSLTEPVRKSAGRNNKAALPPGIVVGVPSVVIVWWISSVTRLVFRRG